MLVRRFATILLLSAGVVTAPAFAVEPDRPSTEARPDTAALRYYAMRGEQDRVKAEISRLRSLYPNWKQPANIFQDRTVFEEKLWSLFGTGVIGDIEAELARLKLEEPDFEPSLEFQTKFAARLERNAIAVAWSEDDWDKILDIANENPKLMLGEDVELIWFVADAYSHSQRPEDAATAMKAAFAVARDGDERRATLRKAAEILPIELVEELADVQIGADPGVDGAIVRGALVRNARLGLPLPQSLVPALIKYEREIAANPTHDETTLMAWWRFATADYPAAHKWFTLAMEKPTPKIAEGAIMAAQRSSHLVRAGELLQAWLDKSEQLGKLYINAYAPRLLEGQKELPEPFIVQFAGKTSELSSGEGAEAMGWYAYNAGQLPTAAAWFDSAIVWEETETSVYGRGLTAARLKDRASFDRIKLGYSSYPKVAALEFDLEKLIPKGQQPKGSAKPRNENFVRRNVKRSTPRNTGRTAIEQAYAKKRYAQCLTLLDKLRPPLRAKDYQMRGWCLLGSNRPAEADRAFSRAVALGGDSRSPSAYGQALAALRDGKTNRALDIANSNKLPARQRKEIDIEILTQRARAAFNGKDYSAAIHALNRRREMTTESRDLSFMRAWSHHNSGDYNGAQDIFATLDSQLSTPETREGLGAARREQSPTKEIDGR